MNQFPWILYMKGLAHVSPVWLPGYCRKPCYSKRKLSVLLSLSDSQSPQYRRLPGCSSLTPLWLFPNISHLLCSLNDFWKEQLHKLPVFKRQLQRGWRLSLHKEPHRKGKGYQVQVALGDILSWCTEEILLVRAIIYWYTLSRTW